jgi:hypothetical protein
VTRPSAAVSSPPAPAGSLLSRCHRRSPAGPPSPPFGRAGSSLWTAGTSQARRERRQWPWPHHVRWGLGNPHPGAPACLLVRCRGIPA